VNLCVNSVMLSVGERTKLADGDKFESVHSLTQELSFGAAVEEFAHYYTWAFWKLTDPFCKTQCNYIKLPLQ